MITSFMAKKPAKKKGTKRKTKYKIGSRSVNVPIHSSKVTEWALGFEYGYKKALQDKKIKKRKK